MCRNHVDILKAKTIGEGDAPSSYFSATWRTSHWGCTASPPNRLTQGETTRGVGCLICLQGRGAFIPAPPSTSVGVFSDPFMVSCCCLMVSEKRGRGHLCVWNSVPVTGIGAGCSAGSLVQLKMERGGHRKRCHLRLGHHDWVNMSMMNTESANGPKTQHFSPRPPVLRVET